MKRLFTLILFICPLLAMAAGEARLLRFPATNGKQVVFTYAGNLYTVPIDGGMARKLTSDVGFEMFSHFSPDGKTMAFTAQYDGNTEVFTLPAEGGEPKRLTYTATLSRDDVGDRMGPNNIVMAWTNDGKEIVYRSRKQTSGFRGLLFKVPVDGGLSEVIPLPEGGFCSFSPDGNQLAYNRVFREFRTWKYYKGGMADDVWIHDFKTKKTVNITNNDAQDIFPMWIGDEVFFLSDRDRTMNLFSYNTKTQKTEKVTSFKDYDIKFPTCWGNWIVFENAGYIYKFNAQTRKAEKMTIQLEDDNLFSRGELKDVSKMVRQVDLSPDAERLVVTARGEVFSVPAKKGVTYNLTNTPGAHERDGSWSPDGKWISYISDETGETEIYLRPQNVEGKAVQLTKNNDSYISNTVWSPDSKNILYLDRKNRLQMVDISTKKVTLINDGKEGAARSASFSPDSKWITYSMSGKNEMGVVYLYNLAEKKAYPVTDRWYSSGSPVFSQDGKYLIFSSARDFNPTYSSTEWNHVYNNMNRVYLAILSKDTPSPFAGKNDEVKVEADSKDKPADSAKPDAKKEADKSVKIDIDGIGDRVVSLPVSPGGYYNFIGINNKVYYSTMGGIKMYDLNSLTETTIADGGSMGLSSNGKKALIFSRGAINIVDLPSSKANLGKGVDLSNLKVMTDYPKEWAQIFDESWRAMRDGFYVENMHGVDWKAMKKKYEVFLPYVNHRTDLTYVIGEMIGELNCGHAYVNSGEQPTPKRIKLGLLGAQVSLDKSGYFRIEKILEGANWSKNLRSPLTEIGIDAKVGEYIVAIDGVPTNTVNDMYKLLIDKADKAVELTLNSKADMAGSRKVIVTPLADESGLYHYNWVQDNIKKVEKATNGKVGYIYIPDMGVDGLNEFAKYYYPQLDKEALIIDDRANGGGNVSPMILERLAREPYRVTMGRNVPTTSVVPAKTLVGPKIVLIDKYSASDGDLFPWGFRELGLGKLVGTRTWGGIVGISGSLPFIDGGDMRVPFFTSYSMRTGEWIIEGHGVDPDIVVDNDPAKEWAGEDEQLNRAIEEIMKDLKNRKQVPPVPKPRDLSK